MSQFVSNPGALFRCGQFTLVALVLQLIVVPTSYADGFLDVLRDIDLNEYALGAFALTSQSYYEGIDNFTIIYPAPTKFGTSITSDETFYIRDGDV